MNFFIRRGRCSDAKFLADVVMAAEHLPSSENSECAPSGYWHIVLDNTSVGSIASECLEACFSHINSSLFSPDIWLVAEREDGTLLGASCCCPDGVRNWDECDAFIEKYSASRFHLPREELMKNVERADAVFRVMPREHRANTYAMEYIGVSPSARRCGIANALTEASLWLAYKLYPACVRAQALVYIGNDASARSLKKFGFVLDHVLTDPEFERQYGIPGSWIMVLPSIADCVKEHLGGKPEPHMVPELQ